MFRGIDNLFPIPIGWYKNEEGLTKTEKKFLIEDQEEKPNEGNTTSKFRRILHDKKCESLKQFVEESLENYFDQVYKPKSDVEPYITQSWCNYSKTGQWHHKHRHPNSFISGVYYIQADVTDKIQFFHPKQYQQIRIHPPRDFNTWNSESWWYGIETGLLVLFPSSFEHFVPPVTAKQTRISLSFNTFLKGMVGDNDSLTGLEIENTKY